MKKEGYITKYFSVGQKIHPVAILNIFNLGFGLIIDAVTGKIFRYETFYNIDLDKEEGK